MRDSIETFNFIKNADFSVDELCLNDLLTTSRSYGGDEELFRATAKMVVKCQDCGGADPFGVTEALANECKSLADKHGERAIEKMAKLILASEIQSFSKLFQFLFDSFNQKYFSGALDRYQVRVVFDLHTVADEPVLRRSYQQRADPL